MLKITRVDFLIVESLSISENSIINKFGNNKIVRANLSVKITKSKSKSKNMVKPVLAKIQSFA